jgi:predicted DCC family thiol-disulfide oxidoreductase YuxK
VNLERELAPESQIAIVYDGDCPLCSSYVKMMRLKRVLGQPTLINARERSDIVRALADASINLDSGMAVYYHGRIYAGGEAMHLLALLTTPVNLANWLTAFLLRHRTVALGAYPVLRFGRNMLLRIRNRSQLEKTGVA